MPTLSIHRGPASLLILAAALLALALPRAMAEPAPASLAMAPLPAEAPTSLFDVAYGSADAELLLDGSWQLGLTGQTGLVVTPGSGTSLSGDVPLVPTQIPDFYLSFLLLKSFFVDTRVSPDMSQLRYAAGYRGADEYLLKEIRAGNVGIAFPVLPFLALGEGSWRSFGLGATLASGGFEGRAMVRYDQATRVERHFVGETEATDSSLSLEGFIRGRWFVLPAKPASVDVFVESSSGQIAGGDGGHYRKLDTSDFAWSSATGLLSLASAASTRVLVLSPSLSSWPGSDGARLSLDSYPGEALLVYDPDWDEADLAALDRFSALCRYTYSGDDNAEVFVRDLSTGRRASGFAARLDPAGYVEVTRLDAATPASAGWTRPFASAAPWLYRTDFEAARLDPGLLEFPFEIAARSYQSASSLTIEKDAIEGSVQVLRNGFPDYAFTVDRDAGTISLATPPGLGEEITISYLRENANRSSGSLAAGLGGLFELGPGSKAWAALGSRWSLPGTSYGQAGLLDPGSVLLVAGESTSGEPFSHEVSLGASWATEAASGRYRIEGMEGASSGSGYQLEGTGFSAASSLDSDPALALSFPTLLSSLHADGSTQKVLAIHAGQDAGSTGDASATLVRYVDAPPLAAFKSLSFFARRGPAVSGAVRLALYVDGGSTRPSRSLSVSLPHSALTTAWRRFTYRYGASQASLSWQDSETGASHELDVDASASLDLSLADSRRLVLEVSAASSGDVVYVDELLLEEAAGRASLLFKGSASYIDEALKLGPASFPLLSGLSLKADLSGALSEESWAAGGASISTALAGLGLGLHARARWSAEAFTPRGGHELGFPAFAFPVKLSDAFDTDGGTGAFGHRDGLSLDLGKIGGLSVNASSDWSPPDAADDQGRFAQEWKAAVRIGEGLAKLEANASQEAAPSSLGLEGGYFGGWIGSFAFLLPAAEDLAVKRELGASLVLGLGAGLDLARLALKEQGLPGEEAEPRRSELSLRLQAPLKFGEGFSMTPYYQRTRTLEVAGAGQGLFDLGALALEGAFGPSIFWTGLPFAEFFDVSLPAAFGSESLSASSAAYTPSFGLSLARSDTSDWLDLALPSSLSLSWERKLSRLDDSLAEASTLRVAARGQAVNLFGAFGVYPLAELFESDEYGSSFEGSLSFRSGEELPRYSAIRQDLLTFYANEGRDSLALDNRLALSRDPARQSWSESLSVRLSCLDEASWLFTLYSKAVEAASHPKPRPSPDGDAAADGKSPENPEGKADFSFVSNYLASLSGARVLSRVTWSLGAALSSRQSDNSQGGLGFELTEAVEWKLTVPQALTLSCSPSLSQTRSGETGVLFFGAKLSALATLTF